METLSRHRIRDGLLTMVAVGMVLAGGAWLYGIPYAPMPLDQLVHHADGVVRARVARVEPELRPDGRGVLTRIHLLILDWYMPGEAGGAPTIEVVQGGGQVGPRFERPYLDAGFRPGQERVLFLRWNQRGGYWLVLGIVQGVFDIVPEGENGEEESSRLIARRTLGHAHGTEEESAAVEAMGMEHFEDCLRRHIAERNRIRVEDEEVGR